MNNVTISGRVSNLAYLKIFGENEAIAYIPVALDKDYLTKEKRAEYKEQGKKTADFVKVKITGKNAIFYAENCYVGRLIEVKGRIEDNTYDYIEEQNDGSKVKVKVRENVIKADRNLITFLTWENTSSDSSMKDFEPIDIDGDIPF